MNIIESPQTPVSRTEGPMDPYASDPRFITEDGAIMAILNFCNCYHGKSTVANY